VYVVLWDTCCGYILITIYIRTMVNYRFVLVYFIFLLVCGLILISHNFIYYIVWICGNFVVCILVFCMWIGVFALRNM
jgi:hypothetical protein